LRQAGRRSRGIAFEKLRRRRGKRVEAEVTPDGKTSLSRRSYASSAGLKAQAFTDAARAHWSIENSLHYGLDATFNEDRAKT
jgi:predicted transposase YbfD/YdcC